MKKTYIIIAIIVPVLGGIWYFGTKVNRQFTANISNESTAKESQIVELKNGDTYNLTASIVKKSIAGSEIKMLAYNGMIPGPTIKVSKGSEITINFTNNIDVLTTVHSHGVRLANAFDGVPDMTQEAVPVDGTFTYKIKFPDEGIYWYHPHVREDYAQELGLYGNYIVTSPEQFYWSEVDREETLFLDDILIENGKVAPFSSVADHALMGRFGNVMLVNGTDKYSLNIKQGERVRFYVTNSSNTRVFNFAIPNTRMKLVGGDNGKYEREEWVEKVLLGPSERAVVEVWFDKDGDYPIQNLTPNKSYILGNIKVVSSSVTTSYFLVTRTNDDVISSINPFRQYFDKKTDKNLVLTVDMGSMGEGSHVMPDGTMMSNGGMTMGGSDSEKIEWEDDMEMMNSMSTANAIGWKIVDQDTKKENEDIDWKFKMGDKVKVKIFNDPKSMHPMQHPIHFHGQRFLVLSTNGVKNKNMVWKDTTLIQKGDTVEILIDMTNPGMWMAHCHIAEHLEGGMMFNFTVE